MRRLTAILCFWAFAPIVGAVTPLTEEIDAGSVEKMNRASQILFKKNRVSEPSMIACYRQAMRGDKPAAVNTFILAKANDFSIEYKRVLDRLIAEGMSASQARSKLDKGILRSGRALSNYSYLSQFESASTFCRDLLKSNPEEAEAVKSIVDQLRKNE